MPAAEGTVRGAFDLDVGPAVRGVREYRRAAAEADVQTRQLGSSIDDAFGPRQVTALRSAREEMGGLGTTSRETRVVVRDQWKGMRREVEREAAGIVSTIGVVRDRMRALGRERVTPQIDLDGVSRALAQVELLHERLNALGRQRATPRVAMGGGFGGGFGSAASRAAAGAAGGGGGGRGIFDLGRRGVQPRNLAIGLGLAYAQPLIGGATALAGSAGSAALGAGAVGLGGLAPLVAGVAGVMAVAKPAQAALKDVWKAQDTFTKAVRVYGRESKQAAAAQRELTHAQRVAGPGAGYAAQQGRGFQADWRRLSRPAAQQYYGLLGDVAQIGRRAAPQLARDALTSTTAVRGSGTQYARFLAGGETQRTLGVFSNAFARELPTVERSLENVTMTMERLARASIPFFHEGNAWLEHQTAGWRESTSNVAHVRDEMRPLVESAKDWGRLTGDTFRLLRDIGRMGAPAGDSLVVDLDETIKRWDTWVHRHPTEVRHFFDETANSVRGIAGALASVLRLLNQLATQLRPLGDEFAQVVGLAAQLGLVGTPGLGAAAFGAYRGLRGRGGGRGGGGMLGGLAPGFLALGGAGGAARGVAAAEARTVFGGAAAARQGRAGERIFGSGFRYGAPTQLARTGLASRAGALGRGALAGAGRGYLPVAAGLAALDFAGFEGGVGDRATAALSSATFGIVPRPLTTSQKADAGIGAANAYLDRLGRRVSDPREQARQIGQQVRGLDRASRGIGHTPDFAYDFAGMGIDVKSRAGVQSLRQTLRDELDSRRKLVREMDRERARRLDDLSRQRAAQYGAGLGRAYNVYRKAGDTPQQAADATVTQIRQRLSKTRNAGVETLGEASLAWARELRRRNPQLTKVVDDVTADIEARFKRMGRRVQIVNGDILTGSRSEWRQIRDAIADPVEQAKERTSADFTEIQRKAVGSLRAMGFSPAAANRLVNSMEAGGRPGEIASSLAGAGLTPGQAKATGSSPVRLGNRRARGGMIGGSGLMDTVPTPDGGLAAPGEGYIANRHTLARISQATRAVFGLTAQQMIRGETRPHWSPGARRFALGGGLARSGALAGVNSAVAQIADAAMAANPGLTVTSTTGGRHALHSLHYRHAAVDLAGGDMNAAAAWIGRHYGRRLTEGIHNPNLSVHDGQTVPPSFWGATTWAGHADHIHVGVLGGGGARGAAGVLAGAGGALGHVRLHGVGMRQPGVPGALRSRAGDIYAHGLQTKINRALGRVGGGDLSHFSGGGDATANMRLGRRMMLAAGFGADQWPSLKSLWTRESGWRANARNPTSGAQGIPQALGHGDIGSSAAEQIRWGLGYIRDRYGSPAAAWAHEQSSGWYSRGGRLRFAGYFDRGGSFTTNGPTAFVAGEGPRHRREKVTVTPAHHGGSGNVTLAPGSVVVYVGGEISAREAERVGELVVRKIIDAIDRGKSQGVIG